MFTPQDIPIPEATPLPIPDSVKLQETFVRFFQFGPHTLIPGLREIKGLEAVIDLLSHLSPNELEDLSREHYIPVEVNDYDYEYDYFSSWENEYE